MGSNVTHVANASGSPIRVFYSPNQMSLEGLQLSLSTNSAGASVDFKRDPRVRSLRIPRNNFGKIIGEGAIYVSVFVENDDDGDGLNISENFYIPHNRSFIVTADNCLKLQKYGANIWVDEQGKRHG
ncbi:hypothetical protein AGOR_G00172370 [Albula goreensis]|uniref:Uncharacterized protein n=1 Tax=Albula goreensis TaxID=1534307 RepID=A0A8T3CXH6_9TELE|nr:hypothetical protein AGOR_G00172370 [Albula goreensis]